MSLLWAILVVIGFMFLLHRLQLPSRGRRVVASTHDVLEVLRRRDLDDLAKERLLRGHATGLFRAGVIILAGGAIALSIPLGMVWLMEYLGLASLGAVLEVLERLDFLAVTLCVGIVVYTVPWLRRKDR